MQIDRTDRDCCALYRLIVEMKIYCRYIERELYSYKTTHNGRITCPYVVCKHVLLGARRSMNISMVFYFVLKKMISSVQLQ